MARVKTGGMQKGYKYTRKKLWYNNGSLETQIFEGDSIPDGYVHGRLKTGRAWNKGLTKYNNESVARMAQKKSKFNTNYKSTRAQYLDERFSNSEEFISFWHNHTCTECVEYFNIYWEDLHFLIQKFNLESPQEHRKLLKDYIFDDAFKQRQSEILKGKNTWSKGKVVSRESIEKQKASYAKRSEQQKISSKQKEYETRKKNGTLGFHKSKDEEILEHILKDMFGPDNVVYNYFDKERYPFKCDFYIPSEDLFIELHAGWEHQGHPFDNNNEEDLLLLEDLKNKQTISNYYKNVIYQWTDLDIRKLNAFKDNNLNYIIGYSVDEINEILKNKNY